SKKEGKYSGINYNDLRAMVESFMVGLMELGIHSGDRVGLVGENRLEWVVSDLAIVSIGAIDVPVFPSLSAKQEEYIFNDSEVVAIIVSNKYQLNKILEVRENIASLRHIIVMDTNIDAKDITIKSMSKLIERGNEITNSEERKSIFEDSINKIKEYDLLTLIYTSGTTGNPKGVMLTHKNIISNVEAAKEIIYFDEYDLFLSFLPMCHAYERTTGYYTAFSSGSTIAFAESIESVATNILEVKPTIMTTVPRLLEMIKRRAYSNIEKESKTKQKIFHWAVKIGVNYVRNKLAGHKSAFLNAKYKLADKLVFSKIRERTGGRLRLFVSGGAPLSVDVNEFFLAAGITCIEGYGLTESSPIISANEPDNPEIGTVGTILKNMEVKIAPDGEILARGPNIMKGYWKDPKATEEAIDENGWLYTGDIGLFTEKGNLKITDRKKYIFVNTGGKNIAPQPIENVLRQSPFIEHCVLVGDKRDYITALISPDFDELKKLADTFGLVYNSLSDLITNPKIIQVIKNDIDRYQKDFAKFERVRKFSLVSQPFSIENGELTPKLSIKRHVVERKFSYLIDEMYKLD
ncbi:MAG: long-chain fatty acid--CoA ligase, partial [FCB group bacterium]